MKETASRAAAGRTGHSEGHPGAILTRVNIKRKRPARRFLFDCRSGVLGVDTIHYRWVVNAATGARAGTLCRCAAVPLYEL